MESITKRIKESLNVRSGDGSGDGSGYGSGYGVKKVNNHDIYIVDDTPTIITALFNNYAKGYIVGNDLTLKPCYIAKNGDIFAHGKTLREAVTALQDKLFEDMPEEERIAAFIECHDYDGVYSNSDLYDWHHKLTGSCEMGRQQFATAHGIDLDGKMSIKEFIKLTKNAYGGEIALSLALAAALGTRSVQLASVRYLPAMALAAVLTTP